MSKYVVINRSRGQLPVEAVGGTTHYPIPGQSVILDDPPTNASILRKCGAVIKVLPDPVTSPVAVAAPARAVEPRSKPQRKRRGRN